MPRLQLSIKLTPCQAKVDADRSRFQILNAGRKFGKTKYALYRVIKAAGKKDAIIWYIAPTYRQAKMIAWRELKRMIPKEVMASKNEQDLTIDLTNGATIYLMGADTPDSLRGPNPDFVVIEEAALHDPTVWPEIIRPALTVKQAGVLFISTPKGMNWYWELWEKAKDLSDWSRFHFTVYDNPYIKPEEIEAARRECHSDVIWEQEYLAQFKSHIGRTIPGFDREKHFLELPPYAGEPMILGVDWGQVDDTAASFCIVRDQRLEVHDFYSANRLGAREQAERIKRQWQSKLFRIERAVLSHDAFRRDPDGGGDNVAYRFQDVFRPVPVVTSDKQFQARTDLLITLAERGKLLIQKSARTHYLAEQIVKLEWKDSAAVSTKGKDDGTDSLGYAAMNVSYELGLDVLAQEERPAGEVDPKDRPNYLRGYPRSEEGEAVFDEVTGYIGTSRF